MSEGKFRWCIETGDINGFVDALKNIKDINKELGNGRRPIHIAADFGQLEMLELLVKKGADRHDAGHRSRHNSFAAVRIAELLSNAGFIDEDAKLKVVSCCSEKDLCDRALSHTKHYVLICTPETLLQRTACILNQGFSGVLADDKSVATALGVASLTPGQRVWLGGLAARMVEFSHDQKDVLNVLKSCENYSTIPPVPKCTVKKPLSLSAVTLKERDSALFCMKSMEIVKNMTPLHDIPKRDAVWSSFRGQSTLFPGVSCLRWYLGDAIGFYFAWLRSYCFSLVFPSSVGLLTWLLVSTVNAIYSDQPIELPTMSVFRVCYGLVVVIWALACNKIWRRQQSQLAEDWMSPVFANAADMSGWVSSHMEQLRPAFRGTLRENPIKGEMELHFSASERRVLYLLSASVTFCCVLVALFTNVLLLNLEGVIDPGRSPYLHFRFIGSLCDPGKVFDPKNGSLRFIPGVLHPLVVFYINQVVFRQVAEKLTDMENHETQLNWDRSLIVKRFLFEAVDAYASPFYLGVILADWNALQFFLMTTFATDSIRRLIIECFIPWFSSYWRGRRATTAAVTHKKSDDALQESEVQSKAVRAAVFGVEYEPFDDFLEMVLEHGYIVLFAIACPPYLPCMAFACAWVEFFFDAFKLLQLVRRPMAQWLHRRQSIWLMLLSVQAWLAIFSNICLLSRYTQWNLLSLFLLEHALIGVGLIIELAFSNTPKAAKNAFRKRFCPC
eukprot:TsM_001012800 transcript=TsM_001012800 gene=TsM_001012800